MKTRAVIPGALRSSAGRGPRTTSPPHGSASLRDHFSCAGSPSSPAISSPPAGDDTLIAREVKLLPMPLAGVAEDGVFEGYASLFGIADLGKDVVLPGAFADSLARRGVRGVRMLWQHDAAEPIGRWLSVAEDGRGLRVRGKLNLAVERAREIHALMREGAIDGLSIGFRVERARHERATGLRRLEKLDLWEISVVTFPMQPGARVSGIRSYPLPLAGRGLGVGVAGRRARPHHFQQDVERYAAGTGCDGRDLSFTRALYADNPHPLPPPARGR